MNKIPGYDPRPSARAEGYEKAKETAPTLYTKIVEALGDERMTAAELSRKMYRLGLIESPEPWRVRPRINEMLANGMLTVADDDESAGIINHKRKDQYTGISVTVYERRA